MVKELGAVPVSQILRHRVPQIGNSTQCLGRMVSGGPLAPPASLSLPALDPRVALTL